MTPCLKAVLIGQHNDTKTILTGQHSDTLSQNQPTNQNSKDFLSGKESEIIL